MNDVCMEEVVNESWQKRRAFADAEVFDGKADEQVTQFDDDAYCTYCK